MKINYNVEVKTSINGKPSFCIINGRCYVCDDSKPVHTNVSRRMAEEYSIGVITNDILVHHKQFLLYWF